MVPITLAFYGTKGGCTILKPYVMLKAIFRDPITNVLMKVTWEIGTPSPFKEHPNYIWNVGEVSASGRELQAINVNFVGLPMVPSPATGEVIWYGDFAKFIAGNLP